MKHLYRLLLVACVLSFPLAAVAQAPKARPLPFDPLGLNDQKSTSGNLPLDLIKALDVKLLPDLQYALKLAQASGSNVTAPCWEAWIKVIQTRQAAVKDGSGADLPNPDPHLITDFERLVELRNMLQPESDFMIKCSPVASMVRKDIMNFMGVVVSGGAGIATLIPGL